MHVLFVVYEKYPVGHWVAHLDVNGFEKYPEGQTLKHVPHWLVPVAKKAYCPFEQIDTHIWVNESAYGYELGHFCTHFDVELSAK